MSSEYVHNFLHTLFSQQHLTIWSINVEGNLNWNTRYYVVAQNIDKAIRTINQQTTQRGNITITPYQQNTFFNQMIQFLINRTVTLLVLQEGFVFSL